MIYRSDEPTCSLCALATDVKSQCVTRNMKKNHHSTTLCVLSCNHCLCEAWLRTLLTVRHRKCPFCRRRLTLTIGELNDCIKCLDSTWAIHLSWNKPYASSETRRVFTFGHLLSNGLCRIFGQVCGATINTPSIFQTIRLNLVYFSTGWTLMGGTNRQRWMNIVQVVNGCVWIVFVTYVSIG